MLRGRGTEEPKIRRTVGEPDKAGKENADQDGQYKGMVFQSAGQGQPVGEQESGQDAQHKCADVQKENIFPKNRGISIVKSWDQPCTGQDSKAEGGDDTGIFFPQPGNQEQGIGQHGDKQQFHVFPDRFIDRREEPHNTVVTAPFVQEVG